MSGYAQGVALDASEGFTTSIFQVFEMDGVRSTCSYSTANITGEGDKPLACTGRSNVERISYHFMHAPTTIRTICYTSKTEHGILYNSKSEDVWRLKRSELQFKHVQKFL